MNYKTAILFCLLFLFLANSVLASVQIEVPLPQIAGQDLTSTSTLGQTVRYVFNLAVILISLMIIGALIYAGFLYLTSSGNPGNMAKAKKRLFGSFLGLLILAGSFFLLKTVNPQFLILRIKRTNVKTGVLFLNEQAYDILAGIKPNPTNEEKQDKNAILGIDKDARNKALNKWLNNSIGEPRVVYIGWNIPDLTKKFGDLDVDYANPEIYPSSHNIKFQDIRMEYKKKNGADYYQFKDFKLKGLFFLPDANKRVIVYYKKDFNKLFVESVRPHFTEEFDYPNCSIFSSSGKVCTFKFMGSGFGPSSGPSVPMSVRIIDLNKGVFLRAKNQKPGESFIKEFPVLDYSQSIQKLSSYGFKDKVNEVLIKNWDFKQQKNKDKIEGTKTKNYLAILFEDAFYKGNLRIFFEKFRLKDWAKGAPPIKGNLKSIFTEDNVKEGMDASYINDNASKIEIKDEPGPYGRINNPSSIKVFNIPQTPEEIARWKANNGCKVWLCPEEAERSAYFNEQNCLVLNFLDYSTITVNSNAFAMFLFSPFRIPDNNIKINYLDDTGTTQEKEIKLFRNIKSMKIQGACIVVLFENKVDPDKCTSCDSNNYQNTKAFCDECWDHKEPGKHSEVFLPGEYFSIYYKTKSDVPRFKFSPDYHQIGTCNCLEGFISRITNKDCSSCASSMAVFPIIEQ